MYIDVNLQVPNSAKEWTEIANDFYTKWNFPNCIGALDGKHVAIRCPNNSGSLNFNYKHTFSIVLMGLADANYKFVYIDVGCKGRVSDGGVYNRSTLHNALEQNTLNIPNARCLPASDIKAPFVIVADDAFALKPYLIKPFNFRNQNLHERVFNYRLSRARRMIESTFGLMASRFRLLRTVIDISENNVKICVLAICALHNYLMTNNSQEYLDSYRSNGQIETLDDGVNFVSTDTEENNAKTVRDIFKNYFVSSAGEVPWQYDMA